MILVERTRRLTKNDLSLICLYASWPVCLVHRFWNNRPPHEGHWFLLPVEDPKTGKLVTADIQYYIFDTGNMLSTSLIILSFILLTKKNFEYQISLALVFIISIMDIIHYWLYNKQNEFVLALEATRMITGALFVLTRNAPTKWKKQ